MGSAYCPNLGGRWLAVSGHIPLSTGGTGCNRVKILGFVWGIPCGVLGWSAGGHCTKRSVSKNRCLSQQIIGKIALSVKVVLGVRDAPVGGAGAAARAR